MREAIEVIIDDYKRRMNATADILSSTQSVEQYYRVSGKHEAYKSIIRELKEVLNHERERTDQRDIPTEEETTLRE